MSAAPEKESLKYNNLPKQVSRKDFNRYILPHLKKRIKGPTPKLSIYKILNYILYVYIPAFNGTNSGPVGINFIGRMSINELIASKS